MNAMRPPALRVFGPAAAALVIAALSRDALAAPAAKPAAPKISSASHAANKAGWELMKQRQWASALTQLETSVTADARNRVAWNNLGVCQLRLYETGQSGTPAVDAALAAFTKADALEPGTGAANIAAAKAYVDQEAAWATAAAARAAGPAREPAATGTYASYKSAGEAAESEGDFAFAQSNYERAEAVSAAKRSKSAAANFQGLLGLRRRDPAAAVEHLRRATTLDPSNKFAWNNLGVALRRRWESGTGGRELLEESVAAFAKVAELDGGYKPGNLADARALLETLGPAPSATAATDTPATPPAR